MLLSVLLQATAAAVGVSKLGAAIGAGLAVIGAGVKMTFFCVRVITQIQLHKYFTFI